MSDRPVALPFVRSPSDRAHDRIKGAYTAEDAIRPGAPLGQAEDSGIIERGEGPGPQTHEEAVEAEENRRETFSDVELAEAEARDALAEKLAEASDEDIPVDSIPNVGSIPGHEDGNAKAKKVNEGEELSGQRAARIVADDKGKSGDHNAEPTLEGDPDSDIDREDELDEAEEAVEEQSYHYESDDEEDEDISEEEAKERDHAEALEEDKKRQKHPGGDE